MIRLPEYVEACVICTLAQWLIRSARDLIPVPGTGMERRDTSWTHDSITGNLH